MCLNVAFRVCCFDVLLLFFCLMVCFYFITFVCHPRLLCFRTVCIMCVFVCFVLCLCLLCAYACGVLLFMCVRFFVCACCCYCCPLCFVFVVLLDVVLYVDVLVIVL